MGSQTSLLDPDQFHNRIIHLEQQGLVTRTFLRLDPKRQQSVFQAILNEAVEKGPADLNIKNVAHRAGIAVGSLYQYFPNRDSMLDFTVEVCVQYMVTMFQTYTPILSSMPLREALHAYLVGGIEWSHAESNLVRFISRAAYHGDPLLLERLVQPVAQVMRDTIHEILSEAANRGEIRPGVDLEAVTRVVNAMMISTGDAMLLPYLNAYFQVSDNEMPFDRIVQALLDLILTGLGKDKERR